MPDFACAARPERANSIRSGRSNPIAAIQVRHKTRGLPPLRRDELWGLVAGRFGIRLPHRAFTPGHSTPLDFLHDALRRPTADLAAWSCRSGCKTLTASLLTALSFLRHGRLQARVLSGSEGQAQNLYAYWRRWCDGPLQGLLDEPPTASITRIAGGRLEVLAASHRRVRGPKVQLLLEDELDEIAPDIDIAAAGMIASRPRIPARTVYTSTWHRPDGAMARLVGSAVRGDIRLHRWNLWEAIAACPAERHENGRGCRGCRLGEPCLAAARRLHGPAAPMGIAAAGTGLYAIDDVIKAYSRVGRSAWDAEYLCNRPSVEGLVYPEFDAAVHARPAPPEPVRLFRSIDWGYGVFVCLWIAEQPCGTATVLDTYMAEEGTLARHAEFIRSHRLGDVEATFCDPAGRSRSDQTGLSNIQVFRRHGIACRYSLASSLRPVAAGVRLVRAALQPASGPPRLFYVPTDANRRLFVTAMQSYRNRRVNGVWIEQPQDPQPHEHIPDALRYYFVNRARACDIQLVGYGAR